MSFSCGRRGRATCRHSQTSPNPVRLTKKLQICCETEPRGRERVEHYTPLFTSCCFTERTNHTHAHTHRRLQGKSWYNSTQHMGDRETVSTLTEMLMNNKMTYNQIEHRQYQSLELINGMKSPNMEIKFD